MVNVNATNLEDAIKKLGNFKDKDLMLVLWTDTSEDCEAVTTIIRLAFLSVIVDNEAAKSIIRAIDSRTRILSIIDGKTTIYITETTKFAEKPCCVVL